MKFLRHEATTHDLTNFIKISRFGESPRFSEKIQSFKLKCENSLKIKVLKSKSKNSLKNADFKSKSVKIRKFT